MRKDYAVFANFICHFGEDNVLLDRAEDIVLPAFFDDALVRSYGKRTHYHFYNVKPVVLEEGDAPVLGIMGRFIKNTELSREQVYTPDEGLKKDKKSLLSSPSSFFVLILNNHRLLYFPETAHAPDLRSFKNTVQHFLREKHRKLIDDQYAKLISEGKKVTKKSLREVIPSPDLEIIPLSADGNIDSFIRRYGLLKRIEFQLVKPNDELDGSELFQEIREYFGDLKPTANKIVASNPEGLDKAAAIEKVQDATKSGNQNVKLTGLDADGNQLDGDNEDLKVSVKIDTKPPTSKGLADKLYEVWQNLNLSGTINTSQASGEVVEKIKRIRSLF